MSINIIFILQKNYQITSVISFMLTFVNYIILLSFSSIIDKGMIWHYNYFYFNVTPFKMFSYKLFISNVNLFDLFE